MIEILHKIHVDDNGCWLMDHANMGNSGIGTNAGSYELYATVSYLGETIGAHRAIWIARKGPIPEGMNVLHSCDRPSCVNLKHLFLGTHKDNTQDMISKDRHPVMKRRFI